MVNVKSKVCLLAAMLAFSQGGVAATQGSETDIIEPVIARQAIDVDLHSADWEIGVFAGAVNLDTGSSNAVTGGRFAYHLNENFFAELSYSETNHTPAVKYFNGVLGYNVHQNTFIASNLSAKSSIFFVAGIGDIEIEGSSLNSVVAGAGYRLMITDSFSLRFDLRGHVHHEFGNDDEWAIDTEANAGVAYFF
ncbi:hypothetical protein [Thalassotalea sp. ND16A]|uniref:hypothetical protein n=1 Tax=Thalassotalea sp. ND16A TaxID=1535422 RepID=UPI00051A6912|nr:hypothetical protein [Thalassotalea sp. ND16A]KGJ97145.1 hypothetical protein ND16A_0067 [Thalassotalea sp. ND16A]